MYWRVEDIISLANRNSSLPLVLCEYSHMMGNSGGCLSWYWDTFDKLDRLFLIYLKNKFNSLFGVGCKEGLFGILEIRGGWIEELATWCVVGGLVNPLVIHCFASMGCFLTKPPTQ